MNEIFSLMKPHSKQIRIFSGGMKQYSLYTENIKQVSVAHYLD